MRRKWIVIGIAAIAVTSLAGRYAWRSTWSMLCLRWAKHDAIASFAADPVARKMLDQVPVSLSLATAPPGSEMVRFGQHQAWVLKPESRQEGKSSVDLKYARMRVRMLKPMESADLDEMAKAFGMKDGFSVLSAAHHATVSGIEAQPDIASVKRQVLLIGVKSIVLTIGIESYYAQFEAANLRGFVKGDISKAKGRVFVEAFSMTDSVNWGLVIMDNGGASMEDVTGFLSAMRVEELPKSAGPTSRATQE